MRERLELAFMVITGARTKYGFAEWFRRHLKAKGIVDISAATMHRWLKHGIPDEHKKGIKEEVEAVAVDAAGILYESIAILEGK